MKHICPNNRKYHGSHFSKVKLYGQWYILIFVEAWVTILVCLGFLHILGKLWLFTGLLTLLLAISRSSALRHSASPYLFLLLPSFDIVYPFYIVNFFFFFFKRKSNITTYTNKNNHTNTFYLVEIIDITSMLHAFG